MEAQPEAWVCLSKVGCSLLRGVKAPASMNYSSAHLFGVHWTRQHGRVHSRRYQMIDSPPPAQGANSWASSLSPEHRDKGLAFHTQVKKFSLSFSTE